MYKYKIVEYERGKFKIYLKKGPFWFVYKTYVDVWCGSYSVPEIFETYDVAWGVVQTLRANATKVKKFKRQTWYF